MGSGKLAIDAIGFLASHSQEARMRRIRRRLKTWQYSVRRPVRDVTYGLASRAAKSRFQWTKWRLERKRAMRGLAH